MLCASNPTLSHLHQQAYEYAKEISEHLLPRTTAYHEIWLDKKMVAGEAVKDFEPMYGEQYLPRKVCSNVTHFRLLDLTYRTVQNRSRRSSE